MSDVLPIADGPPGFPLGDGRRQAPGSPAKAKRNLRQGVAARLHGPGGFYNLGNAIALLSGLAVQLAQAQGGAGFGTTIAFTLFGSPGATWLTIAILVFFVSGEAYHRAWVDGARPVTRFNQLGDLLSTFGAGCLTVALVHLGDFVLALVAGTILAGGKLGTAILPETPAAGPARRRVARLFRSAVVLSRLPSIAALGLEIVRLSAAGGAMSDAFLPGVTLFCFLLWLWADLLLLAGSRRAVSDGPAAGSAIQARAMEAGLFGRRAK